MYMSMQRVRFSSPDAYDKFRTVFTDVRHHLMTKPGFIHLTWWEHPDEAGWYNEISIWASPRRPSTTGTWTRTTSTPRSGRPTGRSWRTSSPFELTATRLLRICPTCGTLQDKAYDMAAEQKVLAEPCPKCGFNFPVAKESENSTAVFKDII